MPTKDRFCVVELRTLNWPSALHIASKRFRLFVAGDVTHVPTETISAFAGGALKRGMVYLCAWGPDCERFHDIVDEVIVEDELGERLFVGTRMGDTVMTTWHEDEDLEESLDFFINLAHPTEGFHSDSDSWVIVCLDNPDWAKVIRDRLEQQT